MCLDAGYDFAVLLLPYSPEPPSPYQIHVPQHKFDSNLTTSISSNIHAAEMKTHLRNAAPSKAGFLCCFAGYRVAVDGMRGFEVLREVVPSAPPVCKRHKQLQKMERVFQQSRQPTHIPLSLPLCPPPTAHRSRVSSHLHQAQTHSKSSRIPTILLRIDFFVQTGGECDGMADARCQKDG